MTNEITCTMDIQLTADLISSSRVIAKGERIRDVQRLVAKYGGRRSKWTKESSPPFEVEGAACEFHWYECHGVGRFEIKLNVISRR